MRLRALRGFELRIPFNAAFKHASAERATTQTIWIEAEGESDLVGFGEACPREYVTGESLQTAHAFVAAHVDEWVSTTWDIATVARWTEQHRTVIDANPAAWAAVEIALLDLLGKTQNRSVESLLGLSEPGGVCRYSAILGSSAPGQFAAQVDQYLKTGFRTFKIKLSGREASDRAAAVALTAAGILPEQVRGDANNLWPDAAAAIGALRALDFPLWAVEEPLPAGDLDGMRKIAHARGTRIILDESVLRAEQLRNCAAEPSLWIINVRVSKMGGLLRTLELLREARRINVRVIVGAHVGESSLLTRVAFTAAAAAGDLLVAQEGAFGTHLLKHDVVDQPLMFGRGGQLDVGMLHLAGAPGFGLKMAETLPRFKTTRS